MYTFCVNLFQDKTILWHSYGKNKKCYNSHPAYFSATRVNTWLIERFCSPGLVNTGKQVLRAKIVFRFPEAVHLFRAGTPKTDGL